jgi:hypothetical protein
MSEDAEKDGRVTIKGVMLKTQLNLPTVEIVTCGNLSCLIPGVSWPP